jgi:Tol biopolymer transport system component
MMSSDRWRQVEDLCHAALACGAEERRSFLANACQGDDELLREVASLLAQESSAERFMSVPAAALAGSAGLDQLRGTLVDASFGSYIIRSLLGVGGMGEVYRAYDETLGREVAIKVLSPSFTTEPERRARFEREARMLATLNHPHIGGIYGVEEAHGVRGLILELVEGETLAERIARPRRPGAEAPGLPVSEALTIARQIAEALEAAHEKGIVHRDLKPANIKITPEGAVKVLDFGLAKVASPDSSGLSHSHAGAVFGTAAYMSPEQARGRPVDRRADIWAFGCVLFEMLTGRVTFAGDTASDTIARILEREPEWSALPSDTPVAIRRLLLRCLAKDARQRCRDAGDVRIEIDAINEVVPGATDVTAGVLVSTRKTWLPWAVVAALVALLAGVIVWEARRPTGIDNPLATARLSRLTDWGGDEAQAEISPDGRFVAFLADHEGQFDLWVSPVGTWKFTNLTQDRPSLDSPSVILRAFGFSGDGTELWFSPKEARAQNPSSVAPRTEAKMLMPLLGGEPRLFLGEKSETPAWSPDGRRLAYFTNGNGDPLFVADRTGADARQISMDQPKGTHSHNPVWSPDGQWIYFVHGVDPTEKMDIWRIQPSGGAPERLTDNNAAVNFLAPLDARTLIYTARAADGAGPALWTLDVPSRTTRKVSSDLERYTSVAVSRDGRRIVATVANPSGTLWRVPLLDRPVDDRDVQPYPVASVRALAPRFAGASLFYLATGGVGDSLWHLRDGQTSEVVRGADMPLSEPAAVSPDGQHIVIVVRRGGLRRLVIMSADGTDVRTLAPSIEIQGSSGQAAADWSPDGSWIAAGGVDADGPALFKIPANGGDPVRIVTGQAVNPVWSPDRNLIAYGGSLVAGQATLAWARPDGTSVDLPPVRVRAGGYRFLPDGKALVFRPTDAALDFWLLDLVAKTTRQLTHLSDRGRIETFDIMPDGKAIVFDRVRQNSDIVLIDRPN